LKDGTICVGRCGNGVPLQVTPPAHMELKVVETDPGVRGEYRDRRFETRETGNRRDGAGTAVHQRRRNPAHRYPAPARYLSRGKG